MPRICSSSCEPSRRTVEDRLIGRLTLFCSNPSAELDTTLQLLVQIDKLVQLIESPVFTCAWRAVRDCLLWSLTLLCFSASPAAA